MPESRTYESSLASARLILAQARKEVAEHEATGAHSDRIGWLRDHEATWAKHVADLEALVKAGR